MAYPETKGDKTAGKNPGGAGRGGKPATHKPPNAQPKPNFTAKEAAALRRTLEEATAEEILWAIQVVLEEFSDKSPAHNTADKKEGA